MSIKTCWSIRFFKSFIFLLMFYLFYQLLRKVLKYPSLIIFYLFLLSFLSVFASCIFNMVGVCTFRISMSSWIIDLSLWDVPLYSWKIFLIQKSTLCDINTVTVAFFGLLFVLYITFHIFPSNLSMSL